MQWDGTFSPRSFREVLFLRVLEGKTYFNGHLILDATSGESASLLLHLEPGNVAQRFLRTFQGLFHAIVKPNV